MTKTLFIYGDSFSDTMVYDPQVRDRLWPKITADLLETQTGTDWTILNHSLMGSSIEYSWLNLRSTVNLWKSGDLVLFLVTDSSRIWFKQDRPDMTNAFILDLHEHVPDQEELDAYTKYFRYIHRSQLSLIRASTAIESIAYWASVFRETTVLILPCFPANLVAQDLGLRRDPNQPTTWHYPHLSKTNGSLLHVQLEEFDFVDINQDQLPLVNWNGMDLRFNHLTIGNHKILAKKIAKFYSDQELVDLTQGFNKNIFSREMLTDISLIPDEIREHHLNKKTIEEYLKFMPKPKNYQTFLDRVLNKKPN